jgi:hypothetical protein
LEITAAVLETWVSAYLGLWANKNEFPPRQYQGLTFDRK